MRSFRSFLLTLAGLTFVAVAALFMASVGMAIAGAAAVLLFGQWLSNVLTGPRQAPERVYVRATAKTQPGRYRVWNDGRGTIIDM